MTEPITAALAAAQALRNAPESTSAPPMPEKQPQGRMATLWRRMTEIYGHRWTAAHGESAEDGSGETWSKGLTGLSAQQLATGLEACIVRADPWPPTLPEFRALCVGVPSLLQVREDLRRKDCERMPFTLLVWRHLDAYAYRMADGRDAERMLREAYADAREAVMRGEQLPIPPPAVQHQQQEQKLKPASEEVVRQELDRMREILDPKAEQQGELSRSEA